MKAIYFGNDPSLLKKVYSEPIRKRIAELLPTEETVYGAGDLPSKDFSNVGYLFSTWGMSALSEETIKKSFPSLKAVFYAAGSVQHFARPFLNLGIRVFSAYRANAIPVIEYASAQIVLANKGFYASARRVKRDGWNAAAQNAKRYPGNYGAKVGLLGVGAIGYGVLKRLKTYQLEIWVDDFSVTEEQALAWGVHRASMKEIFSECDVISNHIANNPQTVGMINRELLGLMKDYATFINTGRGAQVDETALSEILSKNPTVTAVLDVTDPEPPDANSRLYTLDNAVLTPHIAGSSGREVERMAEYMEDAARKVLLGETPDCEITLEMLKWMA